MSQFSLHSILDKSGVLGFHDEYEPILARNGNVATLFLPGGDCAWNASSGGCSVCGFNSKYGDKARYTFKGKPWPEWGLKLLLDLQHRALASGSPETLAIFHGGSFLNPNEIPVNIQKKIVEVFSKNAACKKLFIESRPEYITPESLAFIADTKNLEGKTIQVGIGLESSDNHVRNKIIKKGMPIESFLRAVKLLKERSISPWAYIFLKPHEMAERAAIEDAVSSARFCFENGVDVVSFSCAMVLPGTALHDLWNAGEFRPPWLWSVIEAVMRTREIADEYGAFVRLGSFSDDPPPLAIPHNCDKCSDQIKVELDRFRKTYSINHIMNIEHCDCKDEWALAIGQESIENSRGIERQN